MQILEQEMDALLSVWLKVVSLVVEEQVLRQIFALHMWFVVMGSVEELKHVTIKIQQMEMDAQVRALWRVVGFAVEEAARPKILARQSAEMGRGWELKLVMTGISHQVMAALPYV